MVGYKTSHQVGHLHVELSEQRVAQCRLRPARSIRRQTARLERSEQTQNEDDANRTSLNWIVLVHNMLNSTEMDDSSDSPPAVYYLIV